MQGLHLRDRQDQLRGYGLTLREAARDDEAMRGVPLFASMEAALSFAHLWRATSGVKASEIKEYTGKVGGMILSASEKKAQAGLILDVISSHLSRDQRALLDAEYGGENGERHAGIERLTHLCAHQNRSLARMLMMREFVHGERYCPSQQDIARECAVHQATVSRVASKIAKTIAELRESTITKLTPAFQRRGLIPREEA
jgi:hypothetical protein